MNTCIYDKTDKGREEIATRKYQLPSRLRTLLVMIDGRRSMDALSQNFAGLGLAEDAVPALLSENYIMLVGGGPAADEPELQAAAPRPPASARARLLARRHKLAAGAHGPATQALHEAEDAESGCAQPQD